MREPAPLHPVNREHLEVLSDAIGIMQHAVGSRPDPAHGYCTDDVARALQVDLLHARELGWAAVAGRVETNLRFLAEAFGEERGRFRNFRSAEGSWLDEIGSEDSHGRALLALGEAIASAPDATVVELATALFNRALPAARRLTALRPRALVILACAARVSRTPDVTSSTVCRELAFHLHATFESRRTAAWPWPEARLTYETALPPRALIVAGGALRSQPMVDSGRRVLDWLIEAQVAPDGCLSPIGNGWWSCGGVKSRFDQQPIEATALLLAADSALEVTGDERYRPAIERAYAWFLGANELRISVADPTRGAGFDGLTARGVNTNQGAESTLMWLTALEHVRSIRGRPGRATARAEAPFMMASA